MVYINLAVLKDDKKQVHFNDCNFYDATIELEKYFGFIESISKKVKNKSKLEDEEFYDFLYNSFLYTQLHGDDFRYSKQLPWYFWKLFTFNESKYITKETREVTIDNAISDISAYENYLREKYENIKIKSINKNKVLGLLSQSVLGRATIGYFIFRKFLFSMNFRRAVKKKEFLFISNYERNKGENRFFNRKLLSSKEFEKLIKKKFKVNFNKDKVNQLYIKYGNYDQKNYLKSYLFNNDLGLEDVLEYKNGFSLFFTKFKKVKVERELNYDEKFILMSFNDYVQNKLPIILWFYLSAKNLLKNQNLKVILGDSEKNFFFLLLNIAKKYSNKNVKTVAFSFELVTKNYIFLPLSKKNTIYPDLKLTWNKYLSDSLLNHFNVPRTKLEVFPDPRFFKWEQLKIKKKSILIISQGVIEIYEQVHELENNSIVKDMIKKGYEIYLKPHPLEFIDPASVRELNIVKSSKVVRVVDYLDFVPEYSLTHSSTLIFELMHAKSKGYFISKTNALLLSKEMAKKHLRPTILDAFKEIYEK